MGIHEQALHETRPLDFIGTLNVLEEGLIDGPSPVEEKPTLKSSPRGRLLRMAEIAAVICASSPRLLTHRSRCLAHNLYLSPIPRCSCWFRCRALNLLDRYKLGSREVDGIVPVIESAVFGADANNAAPLGPHGIHRIKGDRLRARGRFACHQSTPVIGHVVESITVRPGADHADIGAGEQVAEGRLQVQALPSATPFPGLIINTKLLQQWTDWFMLKKEGSPAAAALRAVTGRPRSAVAVTGPQLFRNKQSPS